MKLYAHLCTPELPRSLQCQHCYCSKSAVSGMSFIIVAQARFAREVLPLHYKHNNMASFIRQLNMYDFHKIASVESGGLKSDKDEMEFAHQYFIRNHPYLLENIKRKLSNPKSGSANTDQLSTIGVKNGSQSDLFAKVLSDVNILKGKQESWDARLSAMKRENEALWRELAVFRQKHMKQEQIINRLIHFIVTIVQPSRKVPIRRRFPLMLSDTQPMKKITKISGSNAAQLGNGSPPGPTIHEIDSDGLVGSNEKSEFEESGSTEEYVSTDFTECPNEYVEIIQSSEPEVVESVIRNTLPRENKKSPSDWLEVVLTEDDMITNPLTPIDPAKVNPTVAAATLKHMGGNSKLSGPITIKIPSIVTSDSGKKKMIPEKKIIYLADVKKPDKVTKKKQRPTTLKIEPYKNKPLTPKKTDTVLSNSSETLVEMVSDEGNSNSKILNVPSKKVALGKRKLPIAISSAAVKIPIKRHNTQAKQIEAASEIIPPILTPDSLENLLHCKLEQEAADSGEITEEKDGEKQCTSDDSFWKLESLYNGSIGMNELISEVVDGEENSIDENVKKANKNFIIDEEKSSEINLCDVDSSDIELPKNMTDNDNVGDFRPESMAVVCQSPSQSAHEELTRELSSHVDNVQGDIDYLKEVLKGECYNLDMNNLLGYFNEDPLSYGILPPADLEDAKDKENDKDNTAVTGNEVITYGTPPNLMDLVDLFGSTGTVQDWSNLMSPTSPTVSELATPAPSPSPTNKAKSSKRRRI